MTHTINKSDYRTTTPTGLYEANYRRLSRLAPQLSELSANSELTLSLSKLTLGILECYKYTTIVSLRQPLQSHLKSFSLLSAINMELRICHDACLAEVIGYQGKSPIQSAIAYPNKHMLQIDEKRQLNLFLKDVLESALKTENYAKHIHSVY